MTSSRRNCIICVPLVARKYPRRSVWLVDSVNDQAVMEARIAQLEEQLKHVEIIDHDDITTDAVSVGSRVKILDVEYGDEMTYRIVSSLESGGEGETITDESPVGRALLGHKVGEMVDVQAPAGTVSFKILEISR